jgi:hypothetical protein
MSKARELSQLGDVATVDAGKVGIGTTTPDSKFHVYGDASVGHGASGPDAATEFKIQGSYPYINNPAFRLAFKNNCAGGSELGSISAYLDGAVNSGALLFDTVNDGTSAERMRIDKSGNVGIGISPNADSRIHVYGADVNNKYIRTENNNGTSYFGTIGDGAAVVESNTYTKFTTGGSYTERMRIASNGYAAIGSIDPDAQFKVEMKPAATVLAGLRVGEGGTSKNTYDSDIAAFRNGAGTQERWRGDAAGGVLFGTTTAGSAGLGDIVVNGGVYLGGSVAANKLDDYEEGTWTLGTTGGSFILAVCTYTKVGNLVRCTIDAQSDAAGASGYLSGLPFAAANTTGFTPYISNMDIPAGHLGLIVAIGGNTTSLYLRSYGDSVTFQAVGFPANGTIHADFTYSTNS